MHETDEGKIMATPGPLWHQREGINFQENCAQNHIIHPGLV